MFCHILVVINLEDNFPISLFCVVYFKRRKLVAGVDRNVDAYRK
jgi:hypothetical protein